MIWSGLPYSQEDIEKAYLEGAEIDMGKINFPNCKTLEENYETALVYLRNTGYNVVFHFENMNYEQNTALLKVYMNTKIKYDIPILDSTLLEILFACAQINKGLDSILNELELITFVAEQFEFCYNIWQMVASLPLFAISRLQCDGTEIVTMRGIEKCQDDFNTITLVNMIKIPEFDDLYLLAEQIKPKFYEKVFTLENNELFEALTNLSFMIVLHGMMNEELDKYRSFLENI